MHWSLTFMFILVVLGVVGFVVMTVLWHRTGVPWKHAAQIVFHGTNQVGVRHPLAVALEEDPLGVLGIGAALAAGMLWALPLNCFQGQGCSFEWSMIEAWFLIYAEWIDGFTSEVQVIVALIAISLISLVARAGGARRHRRMK